MATEQTKHAIITGDHGTVAYTLSLRLSRNPTCSVIQLHLRVLSVLSKQQPAAASQQFKSHCLRSNLSRGIGSANIHVGSI
jgi:DNA-binding FadR family transcriptional regulator